MFNHLISCMVDTLSFLTDPNHPLNLPWSPLITARSSFPSAFFKFDQDVRLPFYFKYILLVDGQYGMGTIMFTIILQALDYVVERSAIPITSSNQKGTLTRMDVPLPYPIRSFTSSRKQQPTCA
ncbi:hypothetical protein BDW59DRAFT_46969 [Aspergillus cavernicola]|uniref:Uncharacterized protein n=1 Tax=Aspergillus cavernicola TaxID=176166 RepID=A0ABR4J2Z5_9EURO